MVLNGEVVLNGGGVGTLTAADTGAAGVCAGVNGLNELLFL